MPLYEYQCTKGHHFEVQQSMNDEPLSRCHKNGCRAKTQRLISLNGFSLGGSGWYSDGYGSKKNGASETSGGNGCGSSCACDAANSAKKNETNKASS
jgi:putative FmdB family regulatory protein